MAKITLTHKTQAIRKLEALGWTADDVERCIRNGAMTRRFDLFGLVDVMAVKGDLTLGLQITSDSGGNVSAHVQKMLDEPRLFHCLRAGWLVELWGVRNKATRDGSFAMLRSFELDGSGEVLLFNGSDVL